MKLFAAVLAMTLIGCEGRPPTPPTPPTPTTPGDVRESLKAQWQENVVCIRQGDQCGCCNASKSLDCGWQHGWTSITISSCEFAEKMGLRIY